MFNLEEFFGGRMRETVFDEPLCIVKSNPAIEFAVKQLTNADKSMRDELEKTVRDLEDKHNKMKEMLWIQVKGIMKENSLFPNNYNEKTDSLYFRSGVIFHARIKE